MVRKVSNEWLGVEVHKIERMLYRLALHAHDVLYMDYDVDDLVSECVTKIVAVAHKYDPNKGQFITWACWVARNHLSKLITKNRLVPVPLEMLPQHIREHLRDQPEDFHPIWLDDEVQNLGRDAKRIMGCVLNVNPDFTVDWDLRRASGIRDCNNPIPVILKHTKMSRKRFNRACEEIREKLFPPIYCV